MTTQRHEARIKTRSTVLLTLALAAVLAALVALAGMAQEASASYPGANGRIAFQSDRTSGIGVNNPTGDYEIFSMRKDGTGLKQLTFNISDDVTPSYSANGGAIAFASQRDGNKEIYVMNPDGTNQQRITYNTVDDESPTISPDGVWIAFDRVREDEFGTEGKVLSSHEIIAWAAGNEYNLTNNDLNESGPVYSPDGSKIAFESDRDGGSEIFVMNADGTNPTNLTNDPTSADYSPEWSPNGNKIAYESNASGNFDISVMKADGSEKKRLTTTTTGEALPAFSPDGKKIAFVRNRGSNTEIFAKNLSTGSQQQLTNDPASDVVPDWRPLTN
jgi:Tol biopolymer transport system component